MVGLASSLVKKFVRIMKCDIYRPKLRTDIYLFVPNNVSPQSLPFNISSQFGDLEFVKTREIFSGQSIVGANSDEIIKNIGLTGFHLQGIKTSTQVSEGGAAIGGGLLGASVGGPVGAVIGAIIGLALAGHAKKDSDGL